jgi:microcystin-dependent protein
MVDSITPRYNLILPEIGLANSTWGVSLNGNFTKIEGAMGANADAVTAINAIITKHNLTLIKDSTQNGYVAFNNGDVATAQQLRWVIYVDNTAESGNNNANLTIQCYDATGAYLGWCMQFNRATQRVSIAQAPVGGNDIAHKTYVDNSISGVNSAIAANHGIIPVGGVILWPTGSTTTGGVTTTAPIPAGWVQCLGQHYESKDMPALANAIGGYWYYNPNPITGFPDNFTFGVPPLNGRVPVGWDGSSTFGGSGYYVGLTGGAALIALGIGNMPAHDHGFSQSPHSHTDTGHTHPGVIVPGATNTLGVAGYLTNAGNTGTGNAAISANNANITFNAQGNGAGHENRPPYCVLSYLIRYV